MRSHVSLLIFIAYGLYCNAAYGQTRHGGVVYVPVGDGSLAYAIINAVSGDRLILESGRHLGAIIIDKTLHIKGEPGAIIDAQFIGSVITVDAPDVIIESLQLVNSGSSHETLDSGVRLTQRATRSHVIDNLIAGNLIGVDIHGAEDALVARNQIIGGRGNHMNDRGNGVYVWNAPGAVVEDNDIQYGRDGIFVTTSNNNKFRGNTMRDLRFAVHYMYANDSEVVGNISRNNHLGFALMFSSNIVVRDNQSMNDRDYGLMLNYTNDSMIEGNLVERSEGKCLFMYNANGNTLQANTFSSCPIGIHFTAGSQQNTISENAFISNQVQVKYVGSRHHEWSNNGRGNYWSDHTTFDLDGNGIADQSYRPNDIIDHVLWTQPAAKLLLGSPALQLIRWAQRQFPGLLPGSVVDSAPLMEPLPLEKKTPRL